MSSLQMKTVGRITQYSQADGVNYYNIVTPAKDEYSAPSSFRIKSVTPIGPIGSTHEFLLNVSGYLKAFKYFDKNTGAEKQGFNSNVYLEVYNSKSLQQAAS